ncbi:hypothetical protein AMTRI_Chr03g48050 [Amborella trichopoda]|uniref:Uncharacterized protein n=1 Tax=Amborella trichopoda TaxID=13333 RepID=W1PIQ2_AMBTC|nr:hypothetical protein AMTR_s00141p00011830 [Amborella trichopoda]
MDLIAYENFDAMVLENLKFSEPGLDGAMIMALLEEGQTAEGAEEEEKLSDVMRSLEAEIDPNNCFSPGFGSEPEDQCSTSMWEMYEPFGWVDEVTTPMSYGMDQWCLDTCMDEIGWMDQDGGEPGLRECYPFHYVDHPLEHTYSPLWEEDTWQ